MVLDFTADSNQEQQDQRHKKINSSGSKPKSTSPLQNFQQVKGATSRNPMQTNNFFNTAAQVSDQKPTKINSMKTSPSPKSLFDKKNSVSSEPYIQRQFSNIKPVNEKTVAPRAPAAAIPPQHQHIDRIQLLNDLDDYDHLDAPVAAKAPIQPQKLIHQPL